MGHDPERDSAPTEHDELSKPPSERKSATVKQGGNLPAIPRAPALPNFTPPPDQIPSYAPASLRARVDSNPNAAAEPLIDPRDTIRHTSSEPFELSEHPAPAEPDGRLTHRSPPPPLGEGDRGLWDPAELELLDGKKSLVIERFERAADRSVQGVGGEGALEELPMLATLAAGFLTMAPVFRHFAPFDLSLFSMARVDAALDVVYGRTPRPDVASDVSQALLLLGAYQGECLRQAYGGEWRGQVALSDETAVDAVGKSWEPFKLLRRRLERGTQARFSEPGAVHPGAEPFGQRMAIPLAPPAPWDPDSWPKLSLIPRLGRAISDSIVARFCANFGEGPLDRSLASLGVLEGYVGLIAPSKAPRAHDAPWVRRASVLIGAYVGEVVCQVAGAHWASIDGLPTGPESYTLRLKGGGKATPILIVYERLQGKRMQSLRDYAEALTR
jgi:hypothetical protein